MTLESGNRKIDLYGKMDQDTLVIMHAGNEEGEGVWQECEKMECSDFTLAVIGGISWEHDLSPWNAPAAFKKGAPFTGGADAYLEELEKEIIPDILKQMKKKPEKIYLAGYSLAGLFALYSAYRTDLFDGIISASGSMWYPDFLEFVMQHTISDKVKKVYFSVGDKEAKTKNAVMQPVETNTRRIAEHLAEQGIQTTFELNPGGHFVDDALRLAKGICWALKML